VIWSSFEQDTVQKPTFPYFLPPQVDDDVLDMISEAERDSLYEAMLKGDLENDGSFESEIMSIPTGWNDPSSESHVI
jgi:hypothetical protein